MKVVEGGLSLRHSQVLQGADSSSGNGPTAAFQPSRLRAHPDPGKPPGQEGGSACCVLVEDPVQAAPTSFILAATWPPVTDGETETQGGEESGQECEAAWFWFQIHALFCTHP